MVGCVDDEACMSERGRKEIHSRPEKGIERERERRRRRRRRLVGWLVGFLTSSSTTRFIADGPQDRASDNF